MSQPVSGRMGRPTLEEAVVLKQRILDQTLASIREKGSCDFSVNHIAELAGVTKRTIYRHFLTKANLIDAVVVREIDRLRDGLLDADEVRGEDPMARLEIWSRMLFDLNLKDEAIAFAAFIDFEANRDPEMRARQRQWYARVVEQAVTLIEAAKHVSAINAMDSETLAVLLIDLLGGGSHRHRSAWAGRDIFASDAQREHFAVRWKAFYLLTR
ncbi:MAG: hypothetical protein DI606_09965 [Sphingobium sp.]|nr:MAG: hypothetical protein DI606_09965 [Sphingobium sp.]